MFRIITETEDGRVVVRAGRKGTWGVVVLVFTGFRVPVWEDEKLRQMGVVMVAQESEHMESHQTSKWFK